MDGYICQYRNWSNKTYKMKEDTEVQRQIWIYEQSQKRPGELLQILHESMRPILIMKDKDRCGIPYFHSPCNKCDNAYDITLWSTGKKARVALGFLLVIVGTILLVISTS